MNNTTNTNTTNLNDYYVNINETKSNDKSHEGLQSLVESIRFPIPFFINKLTLQQKLSMSSYRSDTYQFHIGIPYICGNLYYKKEHNYNFITSSVNFYQIIAKPVSAVRHYQLGYDYESNLELYDQTKHINAKNYTQTVVIPFVQHIMEYINFNITLFSGSDTSTILSKLDEIRDAIVHLPVTTISGKEYKVVSSITDIGKK